MLARCLLPLLVLLAAWIAKAPALEGTFLYDDHHYVVENPALRGEASLWTSPLGEPWQGLWRPLTLVSWRFQVGDGFPDPGPLLAGNLLLHALAALLVLGLAADLGLSRGGAFLAALLFAVHPVQAEAVAWISGRSELLAAVLVLLAWRLHLRPGRLSALLAALALGAAVLAKENAAAAPALFLLTDLVLGRRPRPWGRLGLATAAVLGVFALRLLVLPGALPAEGPYLDLPLGRRVVVALAVLGQGIQLLAWPFPLRIEYQRDEFLSLAPGALAVLALGLLATVLAWRRLRLAGLGLALVPLALGTVLHLVPIGEPFAERFLYLPSAPFCLALGALFAAWAEREARGRGLGLSLLAAGVLVLAALPASRAACAAFRDEVTLWTQAARAAPQVALSRYNLGLALERAGRRLPEDRDRPGATDELALSLALQPGHAYAAWAQLVLGNHALEHAAGRRPQAMAAARHYREALRLEPGLVDARLRLANVALFAPRVVSIEEARGLLLPLVGRAGLDPVQAVSVEDLLRQLPENSSPVATGTSSEDGS